MKDRECIHCRKFLTCVGKETKRCVNFESDEDELQGRDVSVLQKTEDN